MHLRAPAKINLGLRILGRRPDGYHEIDTVIVPLALADEVEVLGDDDGIRLECEPPVTSRPEDNLAWKAAALLREHAGRAQGARIRIAKRIPVAAGLGGGSSDAAAVLRALVEVWSLQVSPEVLPALAAELGSDVPFFLQDGPARCRGRGQDVTPAPFPGRRPVVLANPGFPVSTAWAYSAFDTANSSLTPRWKPSILRADRTGTENRGAGENDLEPVVLRKFPVIETLKERMLEFGASSASISGSGATVFGLCDSPETAACLAERLRSAFGRRLWVQETLACP